MKCRFENVPNLLSASASAQRSAAQYGQYSAPMYSTSGLPFMVSALSVIVLSGATSLGPAPTLLSTAAGTEVISVATVGTVLAVVVLLAVGAADVLCSDLMTTMATTITMTARKLPP